MPSLSRKLPKIEERRLFPYHHIHILNGFSFRKDRNVFYKYMPLDRFKRSVIDGVFVFVSPDLWQDPFERMYFNADCSTHSYQTEDIACLCVSEKSSTNEDASWRAYADKGGKVVRLSINRTLFLDMMDDYADKNGYEVYIGKAQYGYEKREIMNLYKPGSHEHNLFFPPIMERKHYLSVMTLKRSAFEYENEFRVFLVKDKIPYVGPGLVRVPCDYKLSGLITDIVLSPYPALPTNPALAIPMRERNNQDSDRQKRILGKLVGCPVRQSRLYESGKKVVKVL